MPPVEALWKQEGPKSFVRPHEQLGSALLDEDTALLRVRYQIVDSRGHVPSQVDPRPVIGGLDRHNAITEMAIACRAVMELGCKRDAGRSQHSAQRARLRLRRSRLAMIGIPGDCKSLDVDAR